MVASKKKKRYIHAKINIKYYVSRNNMQWILPNMKSLEALYTKCLQNILNIRLDQYEHSITRSPFPCCQARHVTIQQSSAIMFTAYQAVTSQVYTSNSCSSSPTSSAKVGLHVWKTYGWIKAMKTSNDPIEQWRHVVCLVLVMVNCWCEKMALSGYMKLTIMMTI